MKSDFILNLQRKRSNYSHPDQATSQANSLVLLFNWEGYMSKTSQENMPISYRELSMVEECTSCANKEYFIVRVFDIDTDSPDIYIFNGNLLSYENLENIIES